jgi:2-polyprenyl-3-methyl-5-hydroxy-6-metoxy-1,4-benzoquinol methylase
VDAELLRDEYTRLLEYTEGAVAGQGAPPGGPTLGGFLLFARHLATYELVEEYLGRDVLEAGCFLGYGTEVLSSNGHEVTAIDLDARAIEFASGRRSARFVLADAADMPFKDESFDSVIGFQVLEHLPDASADRFISECHRVLRPGGNVILATPNKAFRLMPGQKPFNPEHIRELTPRQVREIMAGRFDDITIKGTRATGWLEDAEKKRVGRSAMRAYVLNPGSKLAKKMVPGLVKRYAAPAGVSRSMDEFFATAPEVKLTDFRFVDEVNSKVMDIIAIARKS